MRQRRRVLLLLLCAGLVAAGSARAESAQRTEHHSAPLGSGGRLEIDNTIGSIQIQGTDMDGVEIAVHMEVSDSRSKDEARRFLEQIEIDVEQTPGAVYIRTEVPGDFFEKIKDDYQIDYDIRVPHQVQIDAELHVGNVQIDDVSGRVVVETHIGEIDVEVDAGAIEASSHVGRIEASVGHFNGDGRLRFETNVGDIDLKLPADLAVRLEASVNIGDVDCDFDIESQRNTWVGERFSGDINGGGPTLKARANIGSVRLRRSRLAELT